jgi:predicted nucleic acid-binding protein
MRRALADRPVQDLQSDELGVLLAAALILHEVTRSDLTAALDLYAGHDRLDPLDAVYAAAALNRGIDAIVSADRALDGVRGLERVDPLDVAAIRPLGA